MNVIIEYLMYSMGIAVSAVLIFVFEKHIIPWLKLKVGNEKYAELKEKIIDLMIIVEKYFGPKTGLEKKEWVLSELKRLGVEFDPGMANALIDGITTVLTQEGYINK